MALGSSVSLSAGGTYVIGAHIELSSSDIFLAEQPGFSLTSTIFLQVSSLSLQQLVAAQENVLRNRVPLAVWHRNYEVTDLTAHYAICGVDVFWGLQPFSLAHLWQRDHQQLLTMRSPSQVVRLSEVILHLSPLAGLPSSARSPVYQKTSCSPPGLREGGVRLGIQPRFASESSVALAGKPVDSRHNEAGATRHRSVTKPQREHRQGLKAG